MTPTRPGTCRCLGALACCFVGLPTGAASARGPWDPPADYYAGVAGQTGSALRSHLREVIRRDYWNPGSITHRVRSYDAARLALHLLHEDPADPSSIVLIYSGISAPGVWDAGVTWNREHTWPVSRGVGTSGPDYSDLHQLRPCNPTVNNARGNDPFGIGGGYWDAQPSTNPWFTGAGDRAFDPAANDRGEMARAMFYMETRYDGGDVNTTDLTLVNGVPSGNQMGDLARLLEWHYSDPVNDPERLRNHLVFDAVDNPLYYQGNRNPFVDQPEFVWAIWGTGPNNSTLFLGDPPHAPPNDGASFEFIEFRVIVGAPDARPFTLTKTGSTPTTYDVIVFGPFEVLGAGRGRAFTPGTHSAMFWVMPASVASVGVFEGAVVIDNTDLTAAGPGMGADDGDDVVSILASVLSPSNPSLDASSHVDFLSITTQLEQDTGVRTVGLEVRNFGWSPTQARMDVDAVLGGGGRFGVVSGPASGLGDEPAAVALSFDTAGAAPGGVHEETFVVETSDEDIPGETTSQATIVWRVTIVPTPPVECPGDATGDGEVNFGDITAVLSHWFGSGPEGDANGDGTVDFGDITSTLTHWGAICR